MSYGSSSASITEQQFQMEGDVAVFGILKYNLNDWSQMHYFKSITKGTWKNYSEHFKTNK